MEIVSFENSTSTTTSYMRDTLTVFLATWETQNVCHVVFNKKYTSTKFIHRLFFYEV